MASTISVAMQARVRALLAHSPRVILGSASFSRKQIMDELVSEFPGLKYDVVTAGIDEKAIRHDEPQQLVLALGRAKRDAILAKLHEQDAGSAPAATQRGPLLITCDQVVVHQGRILEKPEDEVQCREFIRGYGIAAASTVGSVICTNLVTGRSVEGVDVSTIHFQPIADAVVDKLIEEGECMYCAGGLMIEHPLVSPYIVRIEGSEDGVRGLSKALLLNLLLEVADMPL